jgi:hypothetical protein
VGNWAFWASVYNVEVHRQWSARGLYEKRFFPLHSGIGAVPKTKASKVLRNRERDSPIQDSHFQTYTWKGNDTILSAHGWESNASRWKKNAALSKKVWQYDYR